MPVERARSGTDYEGEPAQHVVRGSVDVERDVWWSGAISVPAGDPLAFVALVRHGPAPGADSTLEVRVPFSELPAVVSLLTGLVADIETATASAT
jgi:hypothetical protein